jgi:hypothetical protein
MIRAAVEARWDICSVEDGDDTLLTHNNVPIPGNYLILNEYSDFASKRRPLKKAKKELINFFENVKSKWIYMADTDDKHLFVADTFGQEDVLIRLLCTRWGLEDNEVECLMPHGRPVIYLDVKKDSMDRFKKLFGFRYCEYNG